MEIIHHREELGTLKGQSVEEGEKAKISKEHQASYEKISRAMARQELKPGVSLKKIVSTYGKPASADRKNGHERWLYRSSKGPQMERPWIFLYFDENGKLLSWECGHTECQ